MLLPHQRSFCLLEFAALAANICGVYIEGLALFSLYLYIVVRIVWAMTNENKGNKEPSRQDKGKQVE